MRSRSVAFSPMSSDYQELQSLLTKTEANLKAIEAVSSNFVLAVLNEWRYTTWHVIAAAFGPEAEREDQRKRAECHLRRAYFDSCDVRIDCLLDEARQKDLEFRDFAAVVNAVFPDYPAMREVFRRASKMHHEANALTSEDRERKYDMLEGIVRDLDEAVDRVRTHEWAIRTAIRKAKIKTVWQFLIGSATIVAALIALIGVVV